MEICGAEHFDAPTEPSRAPKLWEPTDFRVCPQAYAIGK